MIKTRIITLRNNILYTGMLSYRSLKLILNNFDRSKTLI